jgi:regulator of nucleoside diphosphate kinase
MPVKPCGERTLTAPDYARLRRLLPARPPASPLGDLLAAADVVRAGDLPADLVTLYAQVELVDPHTRRRQLLTVCCPDDAEPSAGFVSVLSPVGLGLLGLQAGAVAHWPTPSGEQGSARIVAVTPAPAAACDPVP